MKRQGLVKICLINVLVLGMVYAQSHSYYGKPDSNASEPLRGDYQNLQTKDKGSSNEPIIQVFNLQYASAHNVLEIIEIMVRDGQDRIVATSNKATNSVIIKGSPDAIAKMKDLISTLDVPQREAGGGSLPFICRVYMIEQAAKNQSLMSFQMQLTGAARLTSTEVLKGTNGADIKVEVFQQKKIRDDLWEFEICGNATSSEAIEQFAKAIPDCEIGILECSNNPATVPITQIAPLPKSLEKHIDRFLGTETAVVGYWFGNLSIPGEVRGPIGPWLFSFEMEPLGAGDDVGLNLSVEEARGDEVWEIMKNTMQTQMGQPVIVGYNRDRDGVKVMGTLVVIPEPMPVFDLED